MDKAPWLGGSLVRRGGVSDFVSKQKSYKLPEHGLGECGWEIFWVPLLVIKTTTGKLNWLLFLIKNDYNADFIQCIFLICVLFGGS